MGTFKVIDEEIINTYIRNIKRDLKRLTASEMEEEQVKMTTLAAETAIGVYETIKQEFRDLNDHLGIDCKRDVSRQTLVDGTVFEDTGVNVVQEGSEEHEQYLQELREQNIRLHIIDEGELKKYMDQVAAVLDPVMRKGVENLTDEDRQLVGKHWPILETLATVKMHLLQPLTPHLEKAFETGVSCTYLDGYQAHMYRYFRHMGYEKIA
jgi:hypothetical protein